MENIILVIQNNWQSILEYALMGLMYFLVFLYSNKVKNTRVTLTSLFKDRVPYAEEQLAIAQKRYEKAEEHVKILEARLERCEKALAVFIESEEVENGKTEREG